MSEHKPIGTRIGQQLTAALTGHGIPHDQLSEIIYKELDAIATFHKPGDWIEMPDGTTYTLTFKPSRK